MLNGKRINHLTKIASDLEELNWPSSHRSSGWGGRGRVGRKGNFRLILNEFFDERKYKIYNLSEKRKINVHAERLGFSQTIHSFSPFEG